MAVVQMGSAGPSYEYVGADPMGEIAQKKDEKGSLLSQLNHIESMKKQCAQFASCFCVFLECETLLETVRFEC